MGREGRGWMKIAELDDLNRCIKCLNDEIPMWDYDPIAIIDTSDKEDILHWRRFINKKELNEFLKNNKQLLKEKKNPQKSIWKELKILKIKNK